MRESKPNRPWRTKIISFLTLFLAVATLISLTSAWLSRLANQREAAGFMMGNSGNILNSRYQIETYFLDPKGLWRLFSADFDLTLTDVLSDEDTAVMIPNERTEFKTVVTSKIPEAQKVSLFMHDVRVDANLRDLIVFGVTEPEVMLYTCADTARFIASGTNLVADHLPLCVDRDLAGYESLEIYWYINTSNTATGGTFPALALASSPDTPIVDADGHYYFINNYAADGVTPSEALLCDSQGVVLPGNHTYTGDYSLTTTWGAEFGNLNQFVQISGIYVAIG